MVAILLALATNGDKFHGDLIASFVDRAIPPPISPDAFLFRQSPIAGTGATAQAVCLLMARRRGGGGSGEEVRTLLIDNYDSDTYDIYPELSVVNGGNRIREEEPEGVGRRVEHVWTISLGL